MRFETAPTGVCWKDLKGMRAWCGFQAVLLLWAHPKNLSPVCLSALLLLSTLSGGLNKLLVCESKGKSSKSGCRSSLVTIIVAKGVEYLPPLEQSHQFGNKPFLEAPAGFYLRGWRGELEACRC